MISIIAAIGRNRELGRGNKLLWHIPEDLKRFKKLTKGHAVIMGRKTFESLGKPLPNRLNIIITRDKNYQLKHFNYLNLPAGKAGNQSILVFFSLEEAIKFVKSQSFSTTNYKLLNTTNEVFIIGGGQIYHQGLPYTDKLYLTIVDADCPEADTYFPDYSIFNRIVHQEKREDDGLKYSFFILEK